MRGRASVSYCPSQFIWVYFRYSLRQLTSFTPHRQPELCSLYLWIKEAYREKKIGWLSTVQTLGTVTPLYQRAPHLHYVAQAIFSFFFVSCPWTFLTARTECKLGGSIYYAGLYSYFQDIVGSHQLLHFTNITLFFSIRL